MEHAERVELANGMEAEVMQVLLKYKAICGPEVDPITGEICVCDSDPCPCRVPEGYIPTNYVLVSNWSDFGDGSGKKVEEDWMDTSTSEGMRRSQVIGLLTMAADGMRGLVARAL